MGRLREFIKFLAVLSNYQIHHHSQKVIQSVTVSLFYFENNQLTNKDKSKLVFEPLGAKSLKHKAHTFTKGFQIFEVGKLNS